MAPSARDEILGRLKAAPAVKIPPRPEKPGLKELSLAGEELIKKFAETLVEETGIVHRVRDLPEALEKLGQIVREEGLKKVMATTDPVVASLRLPEWGRQIGLQVMTPKDYPSREAFRDAVFDQAEAGITSADFAVAESGSLAFAFDRDQARLVSLAPILHIAIVPVERIVPVYERVTEKVFGRTGNLPSQFVFITGPSMTGDIEGVLFKGMHGPRRVVVILVG